jgi:HEPN domain-containing protein
MRTPEEAKDVEEIRLFIKRQESRIAALENALRWVIDNRVIWHYGDFARQQEYDALEAVTTPDEVYELVSGLMERST